ncbi:sodium-dependent glucose transporter 1A-like protein [Dinothrombium tinctorium]|uniref:Sodium-dependent glucose transporter 1A-like protein n=1 Tax=Dinothrombium tinctorium TaxID=1965070 RepID=A0A3S3PC45_9ACAR|nr:sodium-dependent glucose transporter 1A-like protein [Dinothrombium tinctorium]
MSFFSELKAHKYTALKTFMLYLMILIAGMNTALCGVTMLDLQLAVNTTSEKITAILPSSSVGFAFGSIAYGFLADHIDVQIILLVTSIILSLSNALIPWNTSLIYLCANMAFNGILFGIIVNGGNVWTLHLWGTESPPFIQALHFAFGFGALIAPLIAEPFLLEIEEKNSTNSTSSYLIMNPEEELKVHYPYLIVSCLLVGIILMGLGTSPIIGAIFGFLQDFIFISSKTASTLFISGSIGQFIIPYATGNFLTTHPPVFLYISFICGVMTCVIHVILTCFRRHYIKQKMKINLQDCDQNDANYELRVLAHDK